MKQNATPISQLELNDFFPEPLQAEITKFNGSLAELATARAALSADCETLRAAARIGNIEKPGTLMADAQKLRARAVALDVAELQLAAKKIKFEDGIRAARKAERDRLTGLANERIAEIKKGLAAINADSRYQQGIWSADSKVVLFNAAAREIMGTFRILTEADELRITELQTRVSACIPSV